MTSSITKFPLSYAVCLHNLMWLLGDSNAMLIDSTIGMCLHLYDNYKDSQAKPTGGFEESAIQSV